MGLEWAGLGPVKWQVEIDDYATKILEKHWPGVVRYRDIRECGRHNLEPVDLVCGGFPCQDLSVAGKRAGIQEGNRSGLWFEMRRIIGELRPRYALIENVPGIYVSGLERVLCDLAEIGYDVQWDTISCENVGGPHKRERVFLVAHARSEHGDSRKIQSKNRINTHEWWTDAEKWGINRVVLEVGTPSLQGLFISWKELDSPSSLCRMVDGISGGLDRLRCLGNAVVPQVAKVIGETIKNSLQIKQGIKI